MSLLRYVCTRGPLWGASYAVIIVLGRKFFNEPVMLHGPAEFAAQLAFECTLWGIFMAIIFWFTYERRRVRRKKRT
jgi:hypothetical protein